MCNRYTLVNPDSAFAEIARILGVPLHKPQWVTQRYNIGLMQVAPAVVNRGAGVEVLPMQFGFFAKGNPQMINNARAETVFSKRSFKEAVVSHRCAIPTTGFIDWETDSEGKKWPHLFTLAHDRPYTLAALWSPGSADKAIPPNFCIVTNTPNQLVARIHDRMPVILREEHVARWLDPAPMAEPEFLEIAKSFPAEAMREQEVSAYINNVKHEGPECLDPPKPRAAQLGLGF
jgi:putative SOS response-associated peptidase YedK